MSTGSERGGRGSSPGDHRGAGLPERGALQRWRARNGAGRWWGAQAREGRMRGSRGAGRAEGLVTLLYGRDEYGGGSTGEEMLTIIGGNDARLQSSLRI
jgi:hypothetical protein